MKWSSYQKLQSNDCDLEENFQTLWICGFDLIVLIVINNATKGDFFAAMQDKKF